jgi:ATP-dependent Clp protease adaptor protein ClpS
MKPFYNSQNKEKEQADGDVLEQFSDSYELVLYNDDFNTFDWVIESLVDVCEHDELQAEQCAYIVHFKGKCGVKSGDFDILEPLQRELSNRNLTADIH